MKYYYLVLSNTVYALRIKKNLRGRGQLDAKDANLQIKTDLFNATCEFNNLDINVENEVVKRFNLHFTAILESSWIEMQFSQTYKQKYANDWPYC